jgi:hypothetical protein
MLVLCYVRPLQFWITNPNNNYTNNVGAGSTMGYGFWLQLTTNPTGPSATTSVCPKFMQVGLSSLAVVS